MNRNDYLPDYQIKAKNDPDQEKLTKWGGAPGELK
jgi:hypothetical protein